MTTKPTQKQLKAWVEAIRSNPDDALHNKEFLPVLQLAQHGSRAVPLVFAGMSGPWPELRRLTAVDHALSRVLHQIAEIDPTPLIAALEDDTIPHLPYLWLATNALGGAKKKSLVVDSLILALKHKNRWIRESAACGLIGLRSKKSIGPLIEALRDRSSSIQFSIVKAINTDDFFRDVRAIPNLRTLVAKRKLADGTRRHAEEALQRLEEESQGKDRTHLSYSSTTFNNRRLAALPDMPGLQSMDLSDTRIDDDGLRELRRFPQLTRLDLNNANATAAGMRHLKPLKHLEYLNIGGRGFHGKAGLAHIAHLPKLHWLHLGGTGVKDPELVHLKKFQSLKTLYLDSSTGDTGLRHVSKVKTLRSLVLRDLPISDAGVEHLTNLKDLRILQMLFCPITDEACSSLRKLTKLESLVLPYRRLSKWAISTLRESLPNCEIEAVPNSNRRTT
jgi:hypothetical protein